MTGAILGASTLFVPSLVPSGADLANQPATHLQAANAYVVVIGNDFGQSKSSNIIAYNLSNDYAQYLDDLQKIEVLQKVVSKMSGQHHDQELFAGLGEFDIMELID